MNKLDLFCIAIRDFEGWHPGSKSYRNKNPGNLRYTAYTVGLGAVDNAGGFCVFFSYEAGYGALKQMVKDAANGLLKWTHGGIEVIEFFQGVKQDDGTYLGGFAPSTDGNRPEVYASFVAKRCGLKVESPLIEVLS